MGGSEQSLTEMCDMRLLEAWGTAQFWVHRNRLRLIWSAPKYVSTPHKPQRKCQTEINGACMPHVCRLMAQLLCLAQCPLKRPLSTWSTHCTSLAFGYDTKYVDTVRLADSAGVILAYLVDDGDI